MCNRTGFRLSYFVWATRSYKFSVCSVHLDARPNYARNVI